MASLSACSRRIFPADDILIKPITPWALRDACATALNVVSRDPTVPDDEPPSEPRPQQLEGARILLVEDNDTNQELALELLSAAGATVAVAGSGEQALSRLATDVFDLVLMDCQMPGMDGYEATRAIRADARWRHLPIIAMTAEAMLGDREKALEAGMNDHISKPVDVSAMYTTLQRWMIA